MLFLVATPIGNLSDITFRAIETLKNSDLILCEDTRHSLKLLNHYAIKKPLHAYHKYNEKKKLEQLISLLKEEKNISLISDAGTPLISDPGDLLVKECIAYGIPITAIPGPSAFVQALVCSGFSTDRFQFIGFLPKKEKELFQVLCELVTYPGVSIAYESPERMEKTVKKLVEINPEIPICISRELTKKFETHLRGTPLSLLRELHNLKGECVLLIQGALPSVDYSHLTLQEHVQEVQRTFGTSKMEAIKTVAKLRNINKRDVYRKTFEN